MKRMCFALFVLFGAGCADEISSCLDPEVYDSDLLCAQNDSNMVLNVQWFADRTPDQIVKTPFSYGDVVVQGVGLICVEPEVYEAGLVTLAGPIVDDEVIDMTNVDDTDWSYISFVCARQGE